MFVDQSRILSISVFLTRCWDLNEVKDLQTGEKIFRKDEQLFFVVAPRSVTFPNELGMHCFEA